MLLVHVLLARHLVRLVVQKLYVNRVRLIIICIMGQLVRRNVQMDILKLLINVYHVIKNVQHAR